MRRLWIIVGLLFMTVFSVNSGIDCYAQSTNDGTAPKLKGLTLSPLRTELNINPGTTMDGKLTVTNSTNTAMKVFLSAEEFKVIDQNYNYSFSELADITKWIKFSPADFSLRAGESKQVDYSIGVPLNAEPGGQYMSLFANTEDKTNDSGISSRQRVASLLYITVLGDVTRVGSLSEIKTPWFMSESGNWSAVLQNTGTTHFRSRYSARLVNVFDGSTVSEVSGEVLVLPNTFRLITDILEHPQFPGIYKAVYSIGLGDTPAVTKTGYVVYIPPQAAVLIVGVILFGLLFFWRKHNKKGKS